MPYRSCCTTSDPRVHGRPKIFQADPCHPRPPEFLGEGVNLQRDTGDRRLNTFLQHPDQLECAWLPAHFANAVGWCGRHKHSNCEQRQAAEAQMARHSFTSCCFFTKLRPIDQKAQVRRIAQLFFGVPFLLFLFSVVGKKSTPATVRATPEQRLTHSK